MDLFNIWWTRLEKPAALRPSLNTSGSIQKSRTSSPQRPDIEENLYNANLDASWELDFFGSKRREIEANEADVEAEIEEMHDVMITLLAEMAVNYADLRTAQARLQVAFKNVAAQTDTWELTDAMFRAGRENALSLDQARYNLESSRSIIPELEMQREKALNRITVLTGRPPGSLHDELTDIRSIPRVSIELAVGVPADVIRHRADIRKAERELAAQTARIGVAKADLYPKLSLIGSIGLEAFSAGKLFSGDGRKWSLGPSITFPLFDAGAIRSNIKANMERQQQAITQYENAVLSALEDVENALVTYAKDLKNNKTLKAAVKAARSAAQLAEIQFSSGVSGFTDVLDAQRSLFSFEDQLIQNQGDTFSDLIRLYKALGGGWRSFEHVAVPELFPDNNE